ncbi:type 2 periplasmic-binding domain-containing protein [Jatrophihabitans fulvus]
MQTTRFRAGAAVLAAAALTLTACGGGTGEKNADGGGSGSGGSGGKVSSIKLVAAEYSKDTQAFWTKFAATYKKKYGITLKVQVVNWNDIAQQSRTMIQNNNAPDILNINYYASYAKDGLLYDAQQVLPSSVQNDLIPAFKTSGTYNGQVYGFPDLSSARALFYNKTLFKKAGITTPPKTWAEFEADAKKIKALGNDTVGYAMPLGKEEAQAEFSIWTFNNNGGWKSDGKWTINSKQNVDTLKFLRKLALDDKVTQNNPGRTNRTDGAFPLFTSGKAGMIVGFSPLSTQLDKDKKVDYGVAPMPTSDGQAPSTYGVTDYLNAFKKPGNQQAVKDFYELYYQPDQVNIFIKQEGFLPVTKSGLKVFSKDSALSVYLQTLPNIRLTPTDDPAWDKVLIDVQQNLGKGVDPDGNPQSVLDDLQKTAENS